MAISEYFPELMALGYVEPYTFTVVDPASITVPAGKLKLSVIPRTIFNQRGLAVSFLLASNNPLLEVSFVIDNRSVTGNFEELKVQSLRGIPKLPFITAYNPTYQFYEAVMEADLTFAKNFNVVVSNPTAAPITILAVEALIYLYKPGFYTALAKLRSGNTVASVTEESLRINIGIGTINANNTYL